MDFRITDPCDERWDAMEARGERRFCERCQHSVLDLTRVSREQARARLRQRRGDYACVRLVVDERGEAVFAPPPSRARHFAGGVVLAAALTAGGCGSSAEPEPTPITALEPCEVDAQAPLGEGPPMVPASTLPGSAAPRETGPVPLDELPSSTGASSPTAEQRQLSRDKHRPQPATPVRPPRPVHPVMGRMPMPRSFP